MIRNTYQQHPEGLLSVYSDNSAVMAGFGRKTLYSATEGKYYNLNQH
jgi:phosphoribosylformylglycinamidine synthase